MATPIENTINKTLMTEYLFETDGIRLEDFKPPHNKPVRYFYILSSNSEPDVIKFGVGHTPYKNTGRWGGFGRLPSYIKMFGLNDDDNESKGCTLYYVGYTSYIYSTERKNSHVAIFEKKLKNYFKVNNLLMKERGEERIKMGLRDLMVHIKTLRESVGEMAEIPTQVRRSPRFHRIQVVKDDYEKDVICEDVVDSDAEDVGYEDVAVEDVVEDVVENVVEDVVYEDVVEDVQDSSRIYPLLGPRNSISRRERLTRNGRRLPVYMDTPSLRELGSPGRGLLESIYRPRDSIGVFELVGW